MEEIIQKQNREIETLERQKKRVSYSLGREKDPDSAACRRLKAKLNAINKRIEECYSQISLLKIRNMMNLF